MLNVFFVDGVTNGKNDNIHQNQKIYKNDTIMNRQHVVVTFYRRFMSRVAKVNWQGDAGFELVDMLKSGKSYRDVINFLYSKYGVSYTAARISQVVKSFKQEGRL